jgi:hypothetical protein
MVVHPECVFTTHNQCIVTLLSRHVSALLGHHQVTKAYNYDIKVIPIPIIVCFSHLMMAQEGRSM